MFVKQLSVFIENREGRLEQVTEVLMNEGINILSLSMADTTEYGMLRMIVSDPQKAKKALCEEGFSAMLTDVIAVKLEDRVGELHKMTHILCGLQAQHRVYVRTRVVRQTRHNRQGIERRRGGKGTDRGRSRSFQQ